MSKRVNYYKDLAADYSKPEPIPPDVAKKLIADAARFIAIKEEKLPSIDLDYRLDQIERENKEWWPTHCEALRQGRGDLSPASIAMTSFIFVKMVRTMGSNNKKRESNTGGL